MIFVLPFRRPVTTPPAWKPIGAVDCVQLKRKPIESVLLKLESISVCLRHHFVTTDGCSTKMTLIERVMSRVCVRAADEKLRVYRKPRTRTLNQVDVAANEFELVKTIF